MSAVTTALGRSSWTATLWKATLIAIPIVTLASLIWLRQLEVNALRQRSISSYGAVPEFELVNQDGKNFGLRDLRGKVWIADFIYTTCPGPCPMISNRMAELQEPLKNTDVHLVSFSVDPARDNPQVLRGYAEKLGAEPGRWDFLTGPQSTIYNLSRNGFKLAVSDGREEKGLPVHSTRMILVDRHGAIRGYYDAVDADAVTKLVADTTHLLREEPAKQTR
jgi:protein SCO1